MISGRTTSCGILLVAAIGLAGCGDGGIFGGVRAPDDPDIALRLASDEDRRRARRGGSTLFDLFRNSDDPNTTVEVNKYIWNAALDVLNFMPVEAADPFSGVLVFGYGAPPGAGRAYRATVYVQDPALDARSLTLALLTRGGTPVGAETQRAVEDAILTRARQLRIRDSRL